MAAISRHAALAALDQRLELHRRQLAAEPPDPPPSHATAAGDTRKLRGIPAIARGVAGATPGSAPGR